MCEVGGGRVALAVCFATVVCGSGTAAEPVSAAVGLAFVAVSAGLFGSYNYAKCSYFYECCDAQSVTADVDGLRADLERYLYGQHLVSDTVVHALRAHLDNDTPSKALVLSFHGCTGCGKNYVADFITKRLFKRGKQSKFVVKFIGPKHFLNTKDSSVQIKWLQEQILDVVKRCGRALIIFDEVDKMPREVLEAVRAYMDFHSDIDGVDFRHAIFLLLGNTGEEVINNVVMEQRQSGKARHQITLNVVEKRVQNAAFNEYGALQDSILIDHYLISHFIAFLPLERSHVLQCIRDHLRLRAVAASKERVEHIADALEYWHEVYSSSGCKRVAQKADLVLEQERHAAKRPLDDHDDL